MKFITRTVIVIAALSGAALSTSTASAMTSSQSARDALRADITSASAQLRVHVSGSTAYLAGNADSQIEVRSAERALEKLDGISTVVTLVSVN